MVSSYSIGQRFVRAKGFSIVELMVAILIGLIILAGVIQVVFTSRTTFFSQEEMSYIQENARYAIDIIGKDIQGAGYWGCAGAGATMALVASTATGPNQFIGPESVVGFEGALTPADVFPTSIFPAADAGTATTGRRSIKAPNTNTPVDYPDAILIRRLEGVPASVKSHENSTRTIVFEPSHDFTVGNYVGLVAEDCQRMGVIRVATAPSATSLTYAAVCGNRIKPNLDQPLTCSALGTGVIQAYLPGSVAFDYLAHAYYIGHSGVLPGQPSLNRLVFRNDVAVNEEVALGVEDMEILYGVVNSGAQAQRYLTAQQITDADWPKVISVQLSLLLRSQTQTLDVARSETYLGNTYNDRFMRQLVTATYRLRNRI
jgi:type IV pilus assembly protein PilW